MSKSKVTLVEFLLRFRKTGTKAYHNQKILSDLGKFMCMQMKKITYNFWFWSILCNFQVLWQGGLWCCNCTRQSLGYRSMQSSFTCQRKSSPISVGYLHASVMICLHLINLTLCFFLFLLNELFDAFGYSCDVVSGVNLWLCSFFWNKVTLISRNWEFYVNQEFTVQELMEQVSNLRTYFMYCNWYWLSSLQICVLVAFNPCIIHLHLLKVSFFEICFTCSIRCFLVMVAKQLLSLILGNQMFHHWPLEVLMALIFQIFLSCKVF